MVSSHFALVNLPKIEYSSSSDKELLAYCQKDDVRAFNELFDRYVGKLYRSGMRYLKEETLVEELTLDILLNLWDRRLQIQLEGELSAYLFRAMHNKAISKLRKQVPMMVNIQALDENIFIADSLTDQEIILKDAEAHYRQLLGNLSPQRQTAFRLSRDEGMSYADIATEMNLSPNTVKNHINAALAYLRHNYTATTMTTLAGLLSSLFR